MRLRGGRPSLMMAPRGECGFRDRHHAPWLVECIWQRVRASRDILGCTSSRAIRATHFYHGSCLGYSSFSMVSFSKLTTSSSLAAPAGLPVGLSAGRASRLAKDGRLAAVPAPAEFLGLPPLFLGIAPVVFPALRALVLYPVVLTADLLGLLSGLRYFIWRFGRFDLSFGVRLRGLGSVLLRAAICRSAKFLPASRILRLVRWLVRFVFLGYLGLGSASGGQGKMGLERALFDNPHLGGGMARKPQKPPTTSLLRRPRRW